MSNRQQVLDGPRPPCEAPFPREEYRERLARIRARMAADGLDLLYLTSPESLHYVSGYACEWYQAESPKSWPPTSGIAIHVDHDDFILFDTPSEQVLVRFVTVAEDVRIFPLEGRRDGIAFVIDELRADGWLRGRVGLEFHSHRPNPAVSRRFCEAFEAGGCEVTDGSDVLRELRWIKSPREMACMEEASRIADIGLEAARDAIRPGIPELEVHGEMIRAMTAAGGENPGIPLPVLSGYRANTGHALASRKAIAAGEQVNVDVCGVFQRYHSNAARSFFVGEPPSDVVRFYEKAAGAMTLLEERLQPGIEIGPLVRALRAWYDEQGIWEEASWVGGYELGIAFPPDWVGHFVYEMTDVASTVRLDPGVAVNFESVFFGPRMTGLTYLIDTILVGEQKARLASRLPRRLIVLDS